MSKRDEQIARMKGLMTYGIVAESKKTPVKDSIEGPDGKVYAIIREGAKYYIKSTPKGSELVAESFDYIGGFMNKKNNEFSSYNQASKNLELKVRSLNEAYGVNKTVEILNPEKKEELMVEMTDSMKASLARYRQIMNNAAGIMNEAAAISASNTGVPEAPKTTSFSPKLGEPFENTAEAKLDKDLKATASDPEKQSEPFGDDKKAEEFKDAQYVPDGSVANKKPSGGKVVRVNENEEYEETIEECDEWGSCGLPSSAGVGEVGDDAPFTEELHEEDEILGDDVLADEPVGFADDDNTLGEGEEEMEIDLDDVDLDLDSEEPADDPELDDMDTEESLDDENELSDELSDELDAELGEDDDELASLRAQVEELTDLVHQLMGDEEEVEDEFEADEEGSEEALDFDAEGSDEFDAEGEGEEELQVEGCSQSLDEDVVDYSGGYDDKGNPINKKAREGEAFGNIADDHSVSGADKRSPWFIAQSEIKQMGLNALTESHAINCLKNVYRTMRNVDYLSAMEDVNVDELTDMVDIMESEMNKLNKLFAKKGNESVALNKISDMVTNYVDQAYSYDEPAMEEPMDNEEELPEEPTMAPRKPARSEEDMDAMAYANAAREEGRFNESQSRKGQAINEEGTKLNVFGKHPGYRKKPMTLPATGSDEGDWNDESVYSEQPFGQEIGSSAPFETVLKQTVDAIVESYKKKL